MKEIIYKDDALNKIDELLSEYDSEIKKSESSPGGYTENFAEKMTEQAVGASFAYQAICDVTPAGDVIAKEDLMDMTPLPKEERNYQTYNLDDAYELGWSDLQKKVASGVVPKKQSDMYVTGYRDGYHDAREISDDGTLTIIVEDALMVRQVNICDKDGNVISLKK